MPGKNSGYREFRVKSLGEIEGIELFRLNATEKSELDRENTNPLDTLSSLIVQID